MTVVWSPRAIGHLADLRAYIARERPDVPWIVEGISGVVDEHAAVVADLAWLKAERENVHRRDTE